jgi:hypothetical protein
MIRIKYHAAKIFQIKTGHASDGIPVRMLAWEPEEVPGYEQIPHPGSMLST